MNVSLNWLAAMLGRPLDAADVAHRLTMACVAVESMEPLHQDLGDVVVGLVERVERHPNADRLSVCQVNDGQTVREVVCGAPNVQAGRRYPYAPVGATLPGGLTLSARKIRGVASQGMLCSARELGLGADQEGILDLETDAAPGTRFLDVMPVADTRLVLDVTANRPDLLGHRGVAREVAISYGGAVRLEPLPGEAPEGRAPRRAERQGTVGSVSVTLDDPVGCPRYIAALIRGVTVRPSPPWLQARLRSVGARPINNVVDATNYLLFELNQPMHAFDLARLRGAALVIRGARARERLRTLDGEERFLGTDMTAICDAETAQAVAGVMGGQESEVTANTSDVVLECAYFDPARVRATRKALRMNTEASYRFERGTDPHAMADAVRRAVGLIRTVAGGEEPDAPVDLYPEAVRPRSVVLRPSRLEHLLGVAVPRAQIERHLAAAGFVAAPKEDRLHVQVPGWRPDVTREVDLIEEVARLKGYDTFPVEVRPFRPSTVPEHPLEQVKARVRRLLMAWGLHEARTLPLVPAQDANGDQVRLTNPLSADHAALRQALLPGLSKSVERNWAVRERDVRLFEIGTRFSGARQPTERPGVAAVVTGARAPAHWSSPTEDWDQWDLKALLEALAEAVAAGGRVVPRDDGWVLLDSAGAQVGRAAPLRLERPAWAGAVLGLEVDLPVHPGPGAPQRRYIPLPVTPAAERDVALLLPEGTEVQQVEMVIREAGGPLLERLSVFDQYRATSLAGRSVALRLVFRTADRTLVDQEVEDVMQRILTGLRERLGVERREA